MFHRHLQLNLAKTGPLVFSPHEFPFQPAQLMTLLVTSCSSQNPRGDPARSRSCWLLFQNDSGGSRSLHLHPLHQDDSTAS